MVRHIILWKLKSDIPADKLAGVLQQLTALEG